MKNHFWRWLRCGPVLYKEDALTLVTGLIVMGTLIICLINADQSKRAKELEQYRTSIEIQDRIQYLEEAVFNQTTEDAEYEDQLGSRE